MSDSVRPHRRKPTRLPHPWDSPGKNTGVGCHFLLQCMKVKSENEVAQSCPTLSDPMDCSLPGSSVHGIFVYYYYFYYYYFQLAVGWKEQFCGQVSLKLLRQMDPMVKLAMDWEGTLGRTKKGKTGQPVSLQQWPSYSSMVITFLLTCMSQKEFWKTMYPTAYF